MTSLRTAQTFGLLTKGATIVLGILQTALVLRFLSPAEYGAGALPKWKSPANTDTVNWSGKALMVHYDDTSKGPPLLLLINMETTDVDFTLPS